MRRLPWVWVLPLLLLLGQYGGFRHELDHYTRAGAAKSHPESQKQRPADVDRCALCLAYGHLSGSARSEAPATGLRLDLGYHHAVERLHRSADPALPAARNRGPPTV